MTLGVTTAGNPLQRVEGVLGLDAPGCICMDDPGAGDVCTDAFGEAWPDDPGAGDVCTDAFGEAWTDEPEDVWVESEGSEVGWM